MISNCVILVGTGYYLRTIIDVDSEPITTDIPITTSVAATLKLIGVPNCLCITETKTFSNPHAVTIPTTGTSGVATPYPSQIEVTDISGVVHKVTITLRTLSSNSPRDIDILLVGPQGQSLIIMSDAGSFVEVMNVTLTFDDDSANFLPQSTILFSGTFKPTNYTTIFGDNYPSPAPSPPYGDPALGQGFNIFSGTDPNGTWSLYVLDNVANFSAMTTIIDGWELTITTCS